MINTIEECNLELFRIDAEIERLRLERQHILTVQEMLRKQMTGLQRTKTLKRRILEIIAANPGIDGASVRRALGDDTLTARQITFSMSDMRKRGELENRGARGQGALWYVKGAE